jgi:hypothetical protein
MRPTSGVAASRSRTQRAVARSSAGEKAGPWSASVVTATRP